MSDHPPADDLPEAQINNREPSSHQPDDHRSNGDNPTGEAARYSSTRYARVNRLDPHHWRAVSVHLGDLRGLDLLEVGAGRGLLLEQLQRAGANAVGIDANPQGVAASQARDLQVGDATALAYEDAAFDAVVSMHTIEHIPNLDAALAEMVRVTRPGGTILLVYPAEPIQGIWAIPTATILHRNPLRAKEIHCHQLTPGRVAERMAELPVNERDRRFSWTRWPQFTSVFARTED